MDVEPLLLRARQELPYPLFFWQRSNHGEEHAANTPLVADDFSGGAGRRNRGDVLRFFSLTGNVVFFFGAADEPSSLDATDMEL